MFLQDIGCFQAYLLGYRNENWQNFWKNVWESSFFKLHPHEKSSKTSDGNQHQSVDIIKSSCYALAYKRSLCHFSSRIQDENLMTESLTIHKELAFQESFGKKHRNIFQRYQVWKSNTLDSLLWQRKIWAFWDLSSRRNNLADNVQLSKKNFEF